MNQIASQTIGTLCSQTLIDEVNDISLQRVAIDQVKVALPTIHKKDDWGNAFKRLGVRESSKSGCLEIGSIEHCHHSTDDLKEYRKDPLTGRVKVACSREIKSCP